MKSPHAEVIVSCLYLGLVHTYAGIFCAGLPFNPHAQTDFLGG